MNTAINYADLLLAQFSDEPDDLKNNIQEHPASSLSHVLLLCHLKKNNDPSFDEVAKQTGIYLQNPYWLQFQLAFLSVKEEKDLKINLPVAESSPTDNLSDLKIPNAGLPESDVESPVTISYNSDSINENDRNDEEMLNAESERIETAVSSENLPDMLSDDLISENTELDDTITTDKDATDKEEELSKEEIREELPTPENELALLNEGTSDLDSENDASPGEQKNDENQTTGFNTEPDEAFTDSIPASVEPSADEQPQANENTESEKHNFEVTEEIKDEEYNAGNPKEEDTSVSGQNAELEMDTADDEPLSFEPLHTVDYFASQGIKLSEDALNNDQLGKQVKSFTAWLKTMKKLHPGKLPEQNEVIEKLIQTSSEASNQSVNVLTEAMAEVLVKQGKSEKAVEMYQKLSLLNPSKSAYFAAKIESIKSI
ncbi:hypothetical protein EFY79_01710 [Hanamia caeni]|jgi:hypothetical protein|uniref:Uncharacterized protein n=1 Tax=Hanamia caeni TaxID=2294116 RepID=A0A3M9NQS9_9BACT|nr:hypothetical protein [Hanamia caeni]RNI40044.1 hypothetical protein EFY79_01710 [Hanamia caeni]